MDNGICLEVRMRRRFSCVMVFGILALAVLCGPAGPAQAEFNVNINIGPPVVVAEPPEVALIPEFGVYFVPGGDVDIFFHAGFWWSPRGTRWYRARECNGPWVTVERRLVPGPVMRVPRDYRARYLKVKRVPYGQWKKARYRRHDDRRKGHSRDGNHRKRGHGHGDD